MSQFRKVKGVKDILPPESLWWNKIIEKIKNIYVKFGYEEIIIPILEYTNLYIRSIGEQTDIVEKEMFTFEDRGGRNICLRPEGTAGTIRAYVENNLYTRYRVAKLYYIGPMFRAERPQKGRLRQFYQFGSETIGSDSPFIDVEVILMYSEILKELGIDKFNLKINSTGCKNCRKEYINKLRDFLNKHKKELCSDCQKRAEKNPLRTLDCKNAQCQKIYENAPKIYDYLCEDCKLHFNQVVKSLKDININFEVDPKLVRGFDYYTRTVFEFISPSLGAQSTLIGGGRYDNLVEEIGGPSVQAVGAAGGIERIVLALENKLKQSSCKVYKSIYIAIHPEVQFEKIFKIINLLKNTDFALFPNYEKRSLKSQLREANKLNIDAVIILAPEELKENKVILKLMKDSKEITININKIPDSIKEVVNYE